MPPSSIRHYASGSNRTPFRLWGGSILFGVWFVVTSLLGAWTVAQHVLPLPVAAPTDQTPATAPLAWYVLGSDCGCSSSVAEDLVRRGPQPGWREQVWLVGDEPALAAQLRRAGFAVAMIEPEKLAREHGIQGAPWLALFDAAGRPVYGGGYARSRPGLPGAFNVSTDLMTAVAAGRPVESLPAFGCATSDALRDRLDPLRLRFPQSP